MPSSPVVRTFKVEYGPSKAAPSLNAKLSPDSPLLLATLDVEWDEPDVFWAIARLEESLLAFSGSFAKHECRGEQGYHVFLGADRQYPARIEAGDGKGASSAVPGPPKPFDGCLALAHLIEHATIDFQCAITGLKRCSGVTAAYKNPERRFDVIVECPDQGIGKTCLALAVSWLTSAVAGELLGSRERQILTAARLAYRSRGHVLTSQSAARALGVSERSAKSALAALADTGYLERTPYTINFSGIDEYLVGGEPSARGTGRVTGVRPYTYQG